MPCSCKSKGSVEVHSTPFSTQTREVLVKNIPSILQKVSTSSLSAQSKSTHYDFSSTTGPAELCYNCIRKHLSVAYTFLQDNNSQTFLTALGEILCAAQHLAAANPQLKTVMQNKVIQAMRGNKDLLLEDLLNWIQNIQTITVTEDPIQPHPLQENLMGLLKAYSLLFIEVSYEQLNKNWATAALVRGAIRKFHHDRDIDAYQEVRKLWKLIESMTLYDQTYEDARLALRKEIFTQWQKYKAAHIV